MKRFIVAILVFVLIPVVSFGAGMLQNDKGKRAIQGFSPNGTLSQILTVKSTTIDFTPYTALMIYSGIQCKIRFMATSVIGSNIQNTVPANTFYGRVINDATQFVNFSGCTGAELQIQ